jgi:hypothetical protein
MVVGMHAGALADSERKEREREAFVDLSSTQVANLEGQMSQ